MIKVTRKIKFSVQVTVLIRGTISVDDDVDTCRFHLFSPVTNICMQHF